MIDYNFISKGRLDGVVVDVAMPVKIPALSLKKAIAKFSDLKRVDQTGYDFVFDNEMLSQIIYADFQIAEVTCPTKYFEEASSINFSRSVKYGLGVLRVSLSHFLQRMKLGQFKLYKKLGSEDMKQK